MFSLEGKNAIVTGGGSGIGRAITEAFATQGAVVDILEVDLDGSAETVSTIENAGGTAAAHECDITSQAATLSVFEKIVGKRGRLDCLVNNAGANFIARTEDLSVRAFDAVTGIVMRGTFLVTHAAGRRWIEARAPGTVVSILSTRLRTGAPFSTPSTMAKAAVESMTRSLSLEWGRHGIRLNAIAPGEIPTEGMSARLRPGETPGAATAALNPLGRAGGPEDIGALAAFLLSPASGWITGETMFMDGGQHRAAGVSSYTLRERSDEDWARIRDAVKARNAQDREGR